MDMYKCSACIVIFLWGITVIFVPTDSLLMKAEYMFNCVHPKYMCISVYILT